jgi:hypothetical protein
MQPCRASSVLRTAEAVCAQFACTFGILAGSQTMFDPGIVFSRRASICLLWVLALIAVAASAFAAEPTTKPARAPRPAARTAAPGSAAPDFAPGAWTDNQEHHVADYRGKILLVFSFDPKYVDSPADVKKKLQTYELFIRDKPVAVVGVIAGHRDIPMAQQLIRPVGVDVPMFFDNISQTSRTFSYSGYSSVYVRMVDPDGKLTGGYNVSPMEVDAALKNLKWKYKDNGYDKRLDAVVDLFEWNHYEAGMKKLQPLRKSPNKDAAASAEKLYQDLRTEGQQWMEDADGARELDPVKAYDLYVRVAAVFAGDELAKTAASAAGQLKTSNKAVQEELAARDMYRRLYNVIPKARYEQRVDVADYCQQIIKKFPDAPATANARVLYDSLMSVNTLD